MARNDKTGRGGVTREEIINMLGYFKNYILISMSSQLNTLQMKKKKEDT